MPYEPEDRSTPELLRDWAAIMRELRARDVVRTNNNPVGDIAEAIVAEHYGGERGSFSQAGWDVRTLQGERIQVKAMRQTAGAKRHNVSPIRDRDYDFVVIVILDEDFVVTEGLRQSASADFGARASGAKRRLLLSLTQAGVRCGSGLHSRHARSSSRATARPPTATASAPAGKGHPRLTSRRLTDDKPTPSL